MLKRKQVMEAAEAMPLNKSDAWYTKLVNKMTEDGLPAVSVFIAFYFNMMRLPTVDEFAEVWTGAREHYWPTKRKFETELKTFME